MNILIVDSDRDMVEMLTGWLGTRGYTMNSAFTADRIRFSWESHEPDLVILDVSMPGVDVLGICRELRTRRDALILAVTTDRDPQVEIQCLESGADAFLTKPFMPKQLIAYIHALGRRVRSTLQRQPSSIMDVGPIHFDASRNEVTVDGRMSRLTPIESRILQILAINTGDVCTLSQIVSHAWGYGDEGDTYLIKAHIRHLREKIERTPSKPQFIRTVPGVGYSLSAGAASAPSDDGANSRADNGDSRTDSPEEDTESSDVRSTTDIDRFTNPGATQRIREAL